MTRIREFIDKYFKELIRPDKNRSYDKLLAKIIQARYEIFDYLSSHKISDSANTNTNINIKQSTKSDSVNHPSHYTSHPSGIECIEITRHYCFSVGNAIKYLWRAGLKKDAGLADAEKEIEDLNKAVWYIKDRINQLKNELQGKT